VPRPLDGKALAERRCDMEETRSEPDRAETETGPDEELGREPLGEGSEGWEELEETADDARS
jgi:hypothetical protein